MFTAHSLPERVLEGDVYVDELQASAARHCHARGPGLATTGRSRGSRPGVTPEPWRGPDINEVIDVLAADANADGVLVCPQGFTADHLEVLYDLDVVAPRASRCGGVAVRVERRC